jgi:hypothetical protein
MKLIKDLGVIYPNDNNRKKRRMGLYECSCDKYHNKYRASLRINRVSKHIGYFKCRLEAAYAYDKYVTDNNLEHTKNFT